MAELGTYFDHTLITTATCGTRRAFILTGQHLWRLDIHDFKKPFNKETCDQTYPALPKDTRYRTGSLGKFAVGSPELALPGKGDLI